MVVEQPVPQPDNLNMVPLFILMALAAGPDIWTEPTLVQVRGQEDQSAHAGEMGRIYAARGEFEAFQVCVRATRKTIERLRIECEPVNDRVGRPDIFRVGCVLPERPSPRACAEPGPWPDVLHPPEPATLEPGERATWWVRYRIPREVEPGLYHTHLRLESDSHRKRELEVRIEVFDFLVPSPPLLPCVATMDRDVLRAFYALSASRLEDWRAMYGAFSAHALSYSVWDGGGLVRVSRDGLADTALLREHLAYVLDTTPMRCVDLAAEGRAADRFPRPRGEDALDPVALYLREMQQFLDGRGLGGRAFLNLGGAPPRTAWDDARGDYKRYAHGAPVLPRLLAAPPHPYFDRYADWWVLPFECLDPELAERLRSGMSLARPRTAMPLEVRASGAGSLPCGGGARSAPRDAVDGSLWSAWVPAGVSKPWIELVFAGDIDVETLRIHWTPGTQIPRLQVDTSFDGAVYTAATVEWKHTAPRRPYERPESVGTFRYANTLRGLRLLFRPGPSAEPAGVAELLWNGSLESGGAPEPVSAMTPWLRLEAEAFPSLAWDAHPVEARMAGWVCWGRRLGGMHAGSMNAWPAAWADALEQPPLVWRVPSGAAPSLYYPGPKAPRPSLRLERLRDGIEDYAYLRLLAGEAGRAALEDPDLQRLTEKQYYAPDPDPETLDEMAANVLDWRVRIGRTLDDRVAASKQMKGKE